MNFLLSVSTASLADVPADLNTDILALTLQLQHVKVLMRGKMTREERDDAKIRVKVIQQSLDSQTDAAYDAYMNAPVARTSALDGVTPMTCRRCDVGTACDPGMERYWTM